MESFKAITNKSEIITSVLWSPWVKFTLVPKVLQVLLIHGTLQNAT